LAFQRTGLKSIRIPSKVEIIGTWCFYECKSLIEVIFEHDCNLKRIDVRAFFCSGLKSIRIPSKVEFIGQWCFSKCESLSEVIFEGNVEIDDSVIEMSPARIVRI
jgi:hypothetical protein